MYPERYMQPQICYPDHQESVDKGEDDNTDITLLPEPIFVRLADEPDPKWISI